MKLIIEITWRNSQTGRIRQSIELYVKPCRSAAERFAISLLLLSINKKVCQFGTIPTKLHFHVDLRSRLILPFCAPLNTHHPQTFHITYQWLQCPSIPFLPFACKHLTLSLPVFQQRPLDPLWLIRNLWLSYQDRYQEELLGVHRRSVWCLFGLKYMVEFRSCNRLPVNDGFLE